MKESGGVYYLTIFLEPGTYIYKFVLDGNKWITDPNAKKTSPDGFGGKNAVIEVKTTDKSIILKKGDGKIHIDGVEHKQKTPYLEALNDNKTIINLKIQSAKGDIEKLYIYISKNGGKYKKKKLTLDTGLTQGDSAFHKITVKGLNKKSVLKYYFLVQDGNKKIFIGKKRGSSQAIAKNSSFKYTDKSIRIFKTPNWVKNGIMYQIFPERFYNGKRSNDPDFKDKDLYYTTPRPEDPRGRNLKPEVNNPGNPEYYYKVKQWDRVGYLGDKYNGQKYFSVYGGDIVGVTKKLNYLKDLGITIIYFNPIFYAKSNHKYDAADFMKVDPTFATTREMKKFIKKAHKMGIRIVIDSSFNHTGNKYFAFRDSFTKGPKSKYWKWYEWHKWPIPKVITGKIKDYYNCWWGFGSLPDLNFDLKASGSNENPKANIYKKKGGKFYIAVDVKKRGKKWIMKYDSTPSSPVGQYILAKDVNWPVVHHIFDVAYYWTKTIGIDGWRLDVANECPFWLWKFFRKVVKQAKPETYLVGEIWSSAEIWLGGDYFDAVMNYKYFKEPVMKFIGEGNGDAAQFDAELKPARINYPKQAQYAQMNLLGSHDTHRYLSAVKNNYPRFMLTYIFSMTYIGSPHIYYGDEIGMQGGKDPDCRRTFYWDYKKIPYRVKLHDWIKKLTHIRLKYKALRTGEYKTVYTKGKTFGFIRWDKKNRLLVLLNSADDPSSVSIDAAKLGLKNGNKLKDLISGKTYTVKSGKIETSLKKVSGQILVKL